MKRFLLFLLISTLMEICIPSCNSNKIACPTYADSFPEKKAKAQTKPSIPKATKPKSGLLPSNARRR